jgi:hypothetical protein
VDKRVLELELRLISTTLEGEDLVVVALEATVLAEKSTVLGEVGLAVKLVVADGRLVKVFKNKVESNRGIEFALVSFHATLVGGGNSLVAVGIYSVVKEKVLSGFLVVNKVSSARHVLFSVALKHGLGAVLKVPYLLLYLDLLIVVVVCRSNGVRAVLGVTATCSTLLAYIALKAGDHLTLEGHGDFGRGNGARKRKSREEASSLHLR